jgi:hypothetical protein
MDHRVKPGDEELRCEDDSLARWYYLKLTGIRLRLLINFNVPRIKDGIRRMVL